MVNLDKKQKWWFFNTIQAWETRSEQKTLLREEKMTYIQSYTYLEITFFIQEAAYAWLSHGYAALDALVHDL